MSTSPAAEAAVRAAVEGGRVATFDPTGNPLIDAWLACAEANGITVPHARIAAASRARPTEPDRAAQALGLPVRHVDLPTGPWWRSDAEALVAQVGDTWCAVVPAGGRCRVIRPDGTGQALTRGLASTVGRCAWALIPALPDQSASIGALRSLAWRGGSARDVGLLVLIGLASLVLGTLVPYVSGSIVSTLVPTGELARILMLTVVLVLAAGVTALVVAVETIIGQRLSSRFAMRAVQASYERLFRLRTAFHREHQPGELAQRVAGIESFAEAVAGALPALISSAALLLSSLIVLGTTNPPLAIAVLVIGIVVVAAGALSLPRIDREARDYTAHSIELGGLVFSLLGGIAKLRTAGAEQRMLDRWTFRFARQQRAARELGRATLRVSMLASLPVTLMPLMLVLADVSGIAPMTVGAFTTATAAAAQAAGAITAVLPIAVGIVTMLPTMRAIAPILVAEPQPRGSAANAPGRLAGDVRLEGVTFGYDGDRVLDDVTIDMPAGTMTAIVGPSGSGKSTIIRLILGLEEPTAGQVLVDGLSLATVDRGSVLAQMGIVPQDAALVPGTIGDNILASSPHLGLEAAWAAAERAGIAEDIRRMPMGLQTVVTEGGGSFSGGQRQRIMIARALVQDPAIIVLDEATSALDNATQAQVTASLAQMGATRIVVAHRLSTIMEADQVVVLDRGRVVESGTFDALMMTDGLFARLAGRQLA